MPRIGRLLFGISVALAGLAAVGVTPAGQLATVSHFQCYRVDPGGVFKSPTLVLSTQFGRQKDSVNPMQLRAPAHKNGSVVDEPCSAPRLLPAEGALVRVAHGSDRRTSSRRRRR